MHGVRPKSQACLKPVRPSTQCFILQQPELHLATRQPLTGKQPGLEDMLTENSAVSGLQVSTGKISICCIPLHFGNV